MSEENAQASSDDMSGLSGFFFYVFIVHPATAWILRPGRFERKKSIMYAIGFLALLAAVKTGECFRFYTYVNVCQLLCCSRSSILLTLPHGYYSISFSS